MPVFEDGDEDETNIATEDSEAESKSEADASEGKEAKEAEEKRDSVVARLKALEEERAELERQLASGSLDRDEMKKSLATSGDVKRKLGDKLVAKMSGIDFTDPATRGTKVYQAIGDCLEEDIESILNERESRLIDRISQAEAKKIDSSIKLNAQKSAWLQSARAALIGEGLDPDISISAFESRAQEIHSNNPGWFNLVPVGEQYLRIAKDVRMKMDKAKQTRRTSESGTLGGSSGSGGRSGGGRGDEGKKILSLSDAMNLRRDDLLNQSRIALGVK